MNINYKNKVKGFLKNKLNPIKKKRKTVSFLNQINCQFI